MIKVEKGLFRDMGHIVTNELKGREYPLGADVVKIFFTDESRYTFLARISDRVIGHALVSENYPDKICNLFSLVVNPLFRYKGAGRKLVNTVADSCGDGLENIRVYIPSYQIEDMEDPYNVAGWLKKTGFKAVGINSRECFRYGKYYDMYIFERSLCSTNLQKVGC